MSAELWPSSGVSPAERPRPVAAGERAHLAETQGEVDAAPQLATPAKALWVPRISSELVLDAAEGGERLSGATTDPQLRGSPRNR